MRFWCEKCGEPFFLKADDIGTAFNTHRKYCDACKPKRGHQNVKYDSQTPNSMDDCEKIMRVCADCGDWFVPFKVWLRPQICPKCEAKKVN
jgi:hypothetical protein